jgi:tetratricopeptide (TPR) repeat protein
MQIYMKLSLLLISYVLVITAGNSETWVVLNNQGIVALEKNDYQRAIECFERAIGSGSNNQTLTSNLIVAYNNYAIEFAKKGQLFDACKYLEKAVQLNPSNENTIRNITAVYLQRGINDLNNKDFLEAEKNFQKSLSFTGTNVPALIYLGRIAYFEQKLTTAEKYWEKALSFDPANSEIQKLLSSLKKENKTEDRFSQVQGDIFEIRYNQNVVHEEVFDIRQHLMDCYREIGQELNFFPKHPIIVLLYEEKEFRGLRNVHDQVSGLFDGKIRIPVNYNKYSLAELKQVLRHEYTHALIYDLVGNSCPVWLNEGLAVFEEKSDRKYEYNIVIQLVNLDRSLTFNQLNSSNLWSSKDLAPAAYSQSFAIIKYMVDRWGLFELNKIIMQFNKGYTFETILQKETNCSLTELDREWKKQYVK